MGQALQVKRCDVQAAGNNQAHHTAAISTERLVVRRGQPFALTLHFGSPVPGGGLRQLRRTSLVAQTGPRPSKADGSLVEIPISRLDNWTGWEAVVEAQDAFSWSLVVTAPPDALVGHYALLLRHVSALGQTTQCPLASFALLFNPWCRGDSVFLPNEAQRQEYVLNQDGTIYWGLDEAPQEQPWDFGQLSGDMVDISLALLEVIGFFWPPDATLSPWALRSPLHVCRLVNALLNSEAHRALLEGCWTGEHSDGTPPFQWPGSLPILRQWLATRCRPVCYGQGWVSAAVMCSVLRTLGIPTRVVSNFSSAQDTAGTLSVEELFDENAAMISSTSEEEEARVWPFRVWNECWMTRQDLEPGYHGWQAIDATPQDTGKGLHCCGPAPVKAIREGRLDLPYDVATFFAATNATCIPWVRLESGELEPAFSSPKYVGNHISTKGVGSERCEDITHNYKAPEGSAEETAVLEKAWQTLAERREPNRGGMGRKDPPWLRAGAQAEAPLLLFARLQAEESSLALGRDARLSVAVTSGSGQERPLQVVLGAQALRYDGRALEQFWKEEFHVTVRDRHEHVLHTTLPYAEYGPALKSSLLLKVTALVRDRPPLSTRSPAFLAWQEIHFVAPGLLVQIPESVTQFQPTEAKVQLRNPLPEPLADCVVSVSGRGLVHKERSYRLGSIEAGATRHLSIPFTPTQAGARRMTIHVGSSSLLQPRRTLGTVRVAPAATQSSPLSREAQ